MCNIRFNNLWLLIEDNCPYNSRNYNPPSYTQLRNLNDSKKIAVHAAVKKIKQTSINSIFCVVFDHTDIWYITSLSKLYHC